VKKNLLRSHTIKGSERDRVAGSKPCKVFFFLDRRGEGCREGEEGDNGEPPYPREVGQSKPTCSRGKKETPKSREKVSWWTTRSGGKQMRHDGSRKPTTHS